MMNKNKNNEKKNKEDKKEEKAPIKNVEKAPLKITEKIPKDSVKMKFKEHKYYNDLNTPHFLAGEVYLIEGADQVQRWLKRGGEIVEGEGNITYPTRAVDKDTIVAKEDEKKETESVEAEEVIEDKE